MNDQTNRTIRADTLEQTSNSAPTQLCAQNEKNAGWMYHVQNPN